MSRNPLVVKLKSGEYDGADIMKAWLLIEELQAQLADKQWHIDCLMFEYCPDEMTDEQMEEWGKNQTISGGRVLTDEEWEWLCNDGKGRPYEALDTPQESE